MIPLEGRVLLNLDEFMLRLGHITTACLVADEVGGNTYRANIELGETLTAPTAIERNQMSQVAQYLLQKGLCAQDGTAKTTTARYPELSVVIENERLSISSIGSKPPEIWWQDYMLAQDNVPSKVGGITIRANTGSKSGLSHIFDWANLLDIISSSGDLSSDGRLINGIVKKDNAKNPYALGRERIIYAWHILSADFDVIARICEKISGSTVPLKRKDASAIYVQCILDMDEEASSMKGISSRQANTIYSAAQDLRRASEKAGKPIEATSTAWHRASSRFESLVDLGLLAKPKSDPSAPYTYQYVVTDRLKTFMASVAETAGVDEWFETSFNSVFLTGEEAPSPTFVDDHIEQAIDLLASGTSLHPISSLLLALTAIAEQEQFNCSIGAMRSMVLDYARSYPSLARLAAGRYGRGAEFISLRRKRAART